MEKFEEQFKNLKNDLEKIKLDEDFKANLKEKMYYEYNTETNSRISNLLIARKVFVAFACCFCIISTCVFADGIQNWFTSAFGSKDKQIETAVENGHIQYVDMDYIQCDNISFKIDFLFCEDNDFYIAFNVLTDIDFDDILLAGLKITGDNGEVIFDEEYYEYGSEHQPKRNKYTKEFIIRSDRNKKTIFLKLHDINEIKKFDKINVKIQTITFRNANEFNKKDVNLEYDIRIDHKIFN